MRIFTAVSLPASIREHIWNSFRPCRDSWTGVKWVEKENVHLTVRFFGEVTEPVLETIKGATQESARSSTPFAAALGAGGSFPERGTPRVIWVGFGRGREEFLSLGRIVERAYRDAGLGNADKELSPHITVARVKERSVPRNAAEEIRSLTFPAEEFRISSIEVFESILRPQGPLYKVIASYELGTT